MSDYWKEREKERRELEGDVAFEVWRNGGNPDEVDMDRLDPERDYTRDDYADLARREMRRQRKRKPDTEPSP